MTKKQLQHQIATLMTGAMTGDYTKDAMRTYDIACALLHVAVELAEQAAKQRLGETSPSFDMIALAFITDAYARLTETKRRMRRRRKTSRPQKISRPKLRLVK
jgi:hypothetical protein